MNSSLLLNLWSLDWCVHVSIIHTYGKYIIYHGTSLVGETWNVICCIGISRQFHQYDLVEVISGFEIFSLYFDCEIRDNGYLDLWDLKLFLQLAVGLLPMYKVTIWEIFYCDNILIINLILWDNEIRSRIHIILWF